jgi:Lytic transglycolase
MSRQSRAVLLTMVMEMDSTVRKTASGERFNAFAMTAAHRTGPMGSYVRVTNLANGRSVRVRINDRGPARRTGKIIDLSYGASRVIGMGGTARVSVQELAEEAMADKTNFTKEEWTLLLESPMIAGMAVTAADPSGLWGLLKESFAGGSALAQAASANTNALVKAVVTDFSSSEGRSTARDGLKAKFAASQPSDLKMKAIDSLRQVSALLDAKAPDDAASFKAWLRQISQSTAEAATEGGGLFGVGGVQVSDAEKATLTEISSALGS